MQNFTHLHVHTQYSILDGAASIGGLISKAKENGMKAIAITDHGNMFGVKLFHKTAKKEGIKPILGCEVYVAGRSRFDKDKTNPLDRANHHLILLAKNKIGYKNLVKLVSYAWTEGTYYKPRIDKDLLRKHKEGLIVSSACLGGEIPQAIMKNNIAEAERVALEFKELFGNDFYLEVMLHQSGNPEKDADVYINQVKVKEELIKLSKKLDIKLVATNDVHFLNAEDADAHDTLICLSTGKDRDDPTRMQYSRQEYLKTKEEMAELFSDIPEVLENSMEIAEKVEDFELDSKPIMPEFEIPEDFGKLEDYKNKYSEDNLIQEFGEKGYNRLGGYENVLRIKFESDYLHHIVFEGANERWGENIEQSTTERLQFELNTIKTMGFPGYFLIVWDFLKAAREMDVSVGPGRGSAAGSAVAYCLKITDIDPVKYNLLFERFLNPDRISMPDIDIDFDEDGREEILQWVVNKYGQQRVANIITFGTMAAKMSIRDVARIEKLPLPDADRLAKLVPEKPGTTLAKAFASVPEFQAEKDNGNEIVKKTLTFAETLEGSVRHTGVHACGIIIGRDDLEEYVPLSTSKDSSLYVTQYDGKHIEDVGMLKMDFLGLKTLSIIKDAVENVKHSKGIELDISKIKLDDKKTYELYSKGETTGLFQFESDGMKKYLKALEPNRFEDLIAMNALYRPGPMDYIPSFIARKHGREKISYDLPEMEEYLNDTYGITVYQEQVMLLSQKLASFTKGQADSLRKAMGKKIKAMMDDLKEKFMEGGEENGHDKKILEKIWHDWEAFAQYAFNKSHSTCYAYVSYQTAYLKAHYPAEFMAAVLSRNLSDIKKVTFFMEECKHMGLDVKGPDVNESFIRFTVNNEGAIRFGMGAIKGVGEAAVQNIINEREEGGPFKDVYNFVERVNLSSVNKRTFEALVLAGAFDGFKDIKRSQFFEIYEGETNFLEALLRYGNKMQSDNDKAQKSLFGDATPVQIKRPEAPEGEDWSDLVKLNKEKEYIGIYLSSHPLDPYKLEINSYCNATLTNLRDLKALNGKDIKVAGIVTGVEHRTTKNGNPFGSLTIEDFTDSYKITMFSKDYLNFKQYFTAGYTIIVKGKAMPRYNNQDELEFKVHQIDMISDLKDKMINSIALKIPIDNLNEQLVTEIQDLAENNRGNSALKFLIYEPETKVWVQMFSRSHKINITPELISYLDTKKEIEYKIF